jgi:hypothetical protein
MPPTPELARQARPLETPSPAPRPGGPVPEMPPQAKPARPGRSMDVQPLWNAAWAEAMADVAAEFTADMARLPPGEQTREKARIDLLLEASTALASGTAAPFGNPLTPANRHGGDDGNATGAAGFLQRAG